MTALTWRWHVMKASALWVLLVVPAVPLGVCAGQAAPASSFLQEQKPPRNLAILIFEGVQIIDFAGPWETFGHVYAANQPVPFIIYTVADTANALTTAMGMSINPTYSVANAPRPDVIVVPGGDVQAALGSPRLMQWLADSVPGAEIVMSVCNGAFILARAGLLDGLEATTTAMLIEPFKLAAPKTKVVSDKRFVDAGKIITTAGVSAGIDGALHVVERLYGRGTAQMAALNMEYNWDPESQYVRASLADKYLPSQYDIESVARSWVPVERHGGTDRWQSKWAMTTESTPSAVLDRIEEAFASSEKFPRATGIKWIKQSENKTARRARSNWMFYDEQGHAWRGAARVEPVSGQENSYIVSVTVVRLP
jgi:putative intracellular protease/amidase